MRHRDLHAYFEATGTKKTFVTKQLGISRFQMAGLLYPDRYPVPEMTPDLAARLSKLLNQSTDYVRRLYLKAA
jgi:hypothetical protein